jgi:hypothetical protein
MTWPESAFTIAIFLFEHTENSRRPSASDGKAGGFLAGEKRPGFLYLQSLRIKLNNLALVLNVCIDIAFPIAHRELRLAIKSNSAGDLSGGGVYRGHVIAAAIECKYSLAVRVVQNTVGIFARCYPLQNGIRLQIENDNHVVAAIADVASVEIIGHRDAMYALHPRDFRDWFL